PAGEEDAGRTTVLDGDAFDLGSAAEVPAAGPQDAGERSHERSGAARPQRHAVDRGGEALQEREERAAGDVRRKVEVHPPGGDERAHLRALEVLLGELPRRLRREPGELVGPAAAER